MWSKRHHCGKNEVTINVITWNIVVPIPKVVLHLHWKSVLASTD